jgi:chromosome segregation ATPase
VYNYTKVNVSLGYSANVFDIARGVVLRTRVGELEREQARLRAELESRERRVAALEQDLRVAQAGELAQVAKQRQELEAQIQAEREAIKRAEERLRALQSPDQPPKKPQDNPQPRTR